MSPKSAAAVIYEVNLEIPESIAGEFEQWLKAHVDEMCALPGFAGARCERVLEPQSKGQRGLCVRYRLESRQALDSYFEHHAARMREDGLQRFGDALRATRRVLLADKQEIEPL